MATLTITSNANSEIRKDVYTLRRDNVSGELASLIWQEVIKEVLKPYGGIKKFRAEWSHSSENTKVVCYVKKGVEVVVTGTLF
jgi:hypothetical protein